MLLTIFLPIDVLAQESLKLNVDKTELKANDTLTVTIDMDHDGSLYAFTTGLSFDENVFEKPEISNFQERDNWSDIVYNEDNHKFALLNKTGKVNDDVVTIKLFVKANPTIGTTKISLNNSSGSNGDKDIVFDDTSELVTIVGKQNGNAVYSSKDEVVENDKEVHTYRPFIIGGWVVVIVLFIGLFLINSGLLPIEFDNARKRRINIVLGVLLGISLIASLAFMVLQGKRGDVNNDGKSDYDDAKKINEYLIDIKNEKDLTSQPLVDKQKYDVNGDGKITITDAAKQVEKTTKTNYKVKLVAGSINYYPEKKAEVKLNFTAKIEPDNAEIKDVYIGGKKVKVTLQDGVYSLTVKASDKAGIQEYTITKVVLSNGREIDNKDLTFKVDVLRDVPTIENFNYDVTQKNLSFTIKNADRALSDIRIKIIKGEASVEDFTTTNPDYVIPSESDGGEGDNSNSDDFDDKQIVYEKSINVNTSKFSDVLSQLEFGEIYTVLITGSYDLDTNKLDSSSNYYENKNLYFATFTAGKVDIESLIELDSLYPKQGESFAFEFDANIEPHLDERISKIVIDGEERDVDYKDDHYVIKIPVSYNYGENVNLISAVILSDGTKILCHHDIVYEVLKQAPKYIDFMYHDLGDDNGGRITFALEDNDEAIIEANLSITNHDSGQVIFDQKLSNDTNDYAFDIANLLKGATYDVAITHSYDLDQERDNDQNDYNEVFNHELIVYDLNLSKVDKGIFYSEKGQEVELQFNAEIIPKPKDNTGVITSVVIDDEIYYPKSIGNDLYAIKVLAPLEQGKKNYEMTAVTLDGDEELDKNLTLTVDVLKDVPTIENLYIDETGETPKILFDIIDKDGALDSDKAGELIIKNGNKEIKTTFPIVSNGQMTKNTMEIVENLQGDNYFFDLKLNYCLDTDKDNETYRHEDQFIYENRKFVIYDASLSLASNNLYFKKNEIKPIDVHSQINPSDEAVTIKSFIMDDEQIVEVSRADGVYRMDVQAPTVAGKQSYNVSKIILSNDVIIRSPLSFTIDVLKDVPYINKLTLNDDNQSLSYELVDVDDAFSDGEIQINDKSGAPFKYDVLQRQNERAVVAYEFLEDKVYNIKFIGSYDLSVDVEDESHSVKNTEMYNHSFLIGGDYNFTLTDVKITDSLQPNEKPVVSFTSTNTRNARVEKVILNDREYSVVNTGNNHYEVKLNDADSTPGEYEVTFDKIKLNTLKTFGNGTDYNVNVLKYTVLKEAPLIKDINLTDNTAAKTITARYNLIDDNHSLVNLTAVLVDSSDKIVSTKQIDMQDVVSGKEVVLSYANNTDGKYRIKFLADYDLGEKYKFTSKNIGEKDIFVHDNDIYVESIVLKNNLKLPIAKYVTKGLKNYEISFNLHVGNNVKTGNGKNYSRTSGITVNGTNYVATQESGYNSKIAITVPDKAGVMTLTVDRVQLELNSYYDKQTNFYSVPEKSIKIEVLKDPPQIKNLSVTEENFANQNVTFAFDLVDLDDSFIGGTIELNGDKHPIEKEHNIVQFTNVPQNENLSLIFRANYDLDTDALNENGQDDNVYDQAIYTTTYSLTDDAQYEDITIADGRAISKNDDQYFEKNEKVKLNFQIKDYEKYGLTPERVIVDKAEYALDKKENGYEVIVDGYSSFGEKNIEITDIIFNNGKRVKLSKAGVITLEVLKDVPRIINYKYDIAKDKITITYELKDYDGAIVGKAPLNIVDEDGHQVSYEETEENAIEITRSDDVMRYYLSIIADYDRDSDMTPKSLHYNGDVVFLNEIISLEKNNIELKDIMDINLYEINVENNEIVLIDKVKVADLKAHLNNYFVEVQMDNMPSIMAKITGVIDDDGKLSLNLDYEYVTDKNTKESQKITVYFGTIDEDGYATNNTHPNDSFLSVLRDLNAGKSVELNRDYDLNNMNIEGATYVTSDFAGTLDGKGHTIKNLSKPLFNTIDGGKVSNLTLRNAVLSASDKGGLANVASSAQITNVIVDGLTRSGDGGGQNGGLVGRAEKNTIIENCGAKNIDIRIGSDQQNGGLIGLISASTVNNSYATGKVLGSWNFNGGFIGNVQGNSKISNSYAKVAVSGNISCDFACSYGGSGVYVNDVSLGSGGNQAIITGTLNNSKNNYYYNDSGKSLTDGIKIEMEDVNEDFFATRVGFDSQIWNLQKASYDNTPTLQFEKTSVLSNTNNKDYDENDEVLYKNLLALTPFYDSSKIISEAKKISDELLKSSEIVHVVPVDKTGNIVTYLTKDDIKKITAIKVVYNNGEHKEYKVIYDNIYDMVASYRIPDLKIDYNFRHYVIDNKSQVVNNLTNYLESLDYTENLDVLTATADSRIYRDFYNEVTSKEIKEFVLKYLSNSNFTNTNSDENINAYIEKSVKKDKKIEKVLYMYNYFRRFYDVEIDGMKLYDFMLFNMEGFDPSLTPLQIADLYFADGNNFNTASTGSKYEAILGRYTKKDKISQFLEYMVTVFGDGDLDQWTRDQFKGYLYEIPIKGHEKDVQYTLWDHFINEDKSYPGRPYDMVLPILTLPKNAAYIISSPVQFIIGAQRTYIENPDDPAQRKQLIDRIKVYAERMSNYFDTAYRILGDATLFNNIHTMHHDKRYAYDENGAKVYQQIGTEEPFHKNFNEVTGRWQTSDGNNAVAWGDRIDWSVAGLLDSDIKNDGQLDNGHVTFKTWSHESAHNIDARLFLRNHGRRFDAGGEDYSDAVFMQSFGANDIVMNLSLDFDKDLQIGSSLSKDRINSPAKIQDFYNKVFETIYVMDYIEAQAFLQLTPEQQEIVGIQVSYPNLNKYTDVGNRYRARLTSGFNQRTADEWADMHLTSINDLIDEQIMLVPGVYKYSSRGSNSYGGEGLNTVHWYQPNNPYGRPDSYALKWLAYEMLGYKGYNDGFVEYNSNIHATTTKIYNDIDNPSKGMKTISNYKTDNMAIKRISGGKYNNIDQYKKARFAEIGDKLKYLNKTIDVNYYTQKFYAALVKDAIEMKERVDNRLGVDRSKETWCLNDYWCIRDLQSDRGYPNSTKVRQEIYQILKKLTDDFNSDIFASSIQQPNINFTIDKGDISLEDINLAESSLIIEENNELLKKSDIPEETDDIVSMEDDYIGSDGDPSNDSNVEESNETEDDSIQETDEDVELEESDDSLEDDGESKEEKPADDSSIDDEVSEEIIDEETDSENGVDAESSQLEENAEISE